MRKLLMSILCIPCMLLAQGTTTSLSELQVPQTARIASLSSAPMTILSSSEGSLLNPASLSNGIASEVFISHIQWFQDVQSNVLSASLPVLFGTFGMAISNLSIDGIEIREIPGPSEGTFTYRSSFFQLTFARELIESLSIGISGKYLYDKIYVDEATGYAVDFGAIYTLDSWHFAASINNIGSLSAFRYTGNDIPTLVRVGIDNTITFNSITNCLYVSYSSNLVVDEKRFHLGLESCFDKTVSLRLGYVTGYDFRGISAGLGAVYSFVRFDYAYLPFSLDLGSSHFFTLTFSLR